MSGELMVSSIFRYHVRCPVSSWGVQYSAVEVSGELMGSLIFIYGDVLWDHGDSNIRLCSCLVSSCGDQYSTQQVSGELMGISIFHCQDVWRAHVELNILLWTWPEISLRVHHLDMEISGELSELREAHWLHNIAMCWSPGIKFGAHRWAHWQLKTYMSKSRVLCGTGKVPHL